MQHASDRQENTPNMRQNVTEIGYLDDLGINAKVMIMMIMMVTFVIILI